MSNFIYIFPEFDFKKYSYVSFLSSLLFIPLSIIIYDTESLPLWYATIIFYVGILSSLHHLRPYGQNNTTRDILRYIDVFFAYLVTFSTMFLFKNNIFIYFIYSIIKLLFYCIDKCKTYKLKTILHACIHIIFVLFIWYQVIIIPSPVIDPCTL